MTRNGIAAAAILSIAFLAGCQSARYVVREADHGVVAIPVGSERYRREAEQLMREHFPDGYTIVREEEVLVDQTPTTTQQIRSQLAEQGRRPFAGAGAPGPGGGMTTTNERAEVRITYFRDQPVSPQAADVPIADYEAGESLFSTAGMIDPAATAN
jgi:hypothetical protein